jgi:hypothetical protein
MKSTTLVKELQQAVAVFDRQKVEQLCSQLVEQLQMRPRPYPAGEAVTILYTLRRKRYFDLLLKVGDVLIQTGQSSAEVRRLYAQGLIDSGHISAALNVLKVLEQDCRREKNSKELAKVRGLMGRAHKQMYVNGAVGKRPGTELRKRLKDGLTDYAALYKKGGDNFWPGVNTLALLERAKQDKIKLPTNLPNVKATANNIIKQITAKKTVDLWDYAAAAEASLALQEHAQARDWIIKYTQKNDMADAFEYASTLRQFEEVWRLDSSNLEQASILHLLRVALLKQEGGQVHLQSAAQELDSVSRLEAGGQFEQILGKDRYKTIRWYRIGLERAAGVAKISDRFGNGLGTGFIVCGQDIHPSITEEWVLVTNAHVISDDPEEQAGSPRALPADEAKISFEATGYGAELDVDKLIFSSGRNQLDCSIVTLKSFSLEHAKPYPIAKRLPLLGKNQRVYIIGHPRGSVLSFSMDDNLLLDYEKPKIHYRAPTAGGSSGSPVFDQNWELLALHHAGGMNMHKLNGKSGSYPANEGLYFQNILDAVAQSFQAG